MLSIAEVNIELLLRSGVEAEVGLVGEVVSVEEELHEGGLRDESLWLFSLSAEQTRILPVAQLRLGVPVYDLKHPAEGARQYGNVYQENYQSETRVDKDIENRFVSTDFPYT